jgi:hypothetical protein
MLLMQTLAQTTDPEDMLMAVLRALLAADVEFKAKSATLPMVVLVWY